MTCSNNNNKCDGGIIHLVTILKFINLNESVHVNIVHFVKIELTSLNVLEVILDSQTRPIKLFLDVAGTFVPPVRAPGCS